MVWLAFFAAACLRPLIAATQQVPDRDTLWREDLKVFAESAPHQSLPVWYGFQFRITVIGAAFSSTTVSIRKR